MMRHCCILLAAQGACGLFEARHEPVMFGYRSVDERQSRVESPHARVTRSTTHHTSHTWCLHEHSNIITAERDSHLQGWMPHIVDTLV
jgi:hypothetical protein